MELGFARNVLSYTRGMMQNSEIVLSSHKDARLSLYCIEFYGRKFKSLHFFLSMTHPAPLPRIGVTERNEHQRVISQRSAGWWPPWPLPPTNSPSSCSSRRRRRRSRPSRPENPLDFDGLRVWRRRQGRGSTLKSLSLWIYFKNYRVTMMVRD